MRLLRPLLAWLVLCCFILGGCASTGPSPAEPELPPIRPDTIARLKVDGANAFINGQRAQNGSYVADGDTVTTGARTSAMLVLNEGGWIQLDENTDPLFRQGACLLMKLFRGRVAFHNVKCQEFEDGLKMAGVARSLVHIMSSENASRVTVIAGQVEMRSPEPATLGADSEYVATAAGAVQVLRLTPQESSARIAWTRNYFRTPAAQEPGGVSPAGAAAIGGAIGALWRIFHDDSDKRQEPPPGPQPQPEPAPPLPTEPQPEPAPPPAPPAEPPPAEPPPVESLPEPQIELPRNTDPTPSYEPPPPPQPAPRIELPRNTDVAPPPEPAPAPPPTEQPVPEIKEEKPPVLH